VRSWTFVNFEERFERWLKIDSPDSDLSLHVAVWLHDMQADPYKGARRADGHDNLWFTPIPRAYMPDGTQVTCSYWIEVMPRIVRCDSIICLSPPFAY
jgi:hypothetical protein